MSKLISELHESATKTLTEQWNRLVRPLSEFEEQEDAMADLEMSQRLLENSRQRIRLAVAYRTLDAYGLNEGICNHLTALAPSRGNRDKEVMLVIPYGLQWSEVTPNNLIGLDEDDKTLEGEGTADITAICIHRGVYKARNDVRSVMHTHMPYATALSCLKDPTLRMVHQNSARFYKRLAYDNGYSGLATAHEEGQRIAGNLGSLDAVLLGNHGVLTVGKTISIAFDLMYYLERAALIQVLAMSTGKELNELTPEVAKETEKIFWKDVEQYADSHLESAKRKLAIKHQEFRY